MRRILIVLILLLLLPISVSAHGGKTDSDGGHTDHSTGEYHYHHGYPAHDHKDMDGDGIKDCPYEFDDNTDHSPGSSGNNGIQYPGIIVTPSTKPVTTITSSSEPINHPGENTASGRKITFSLIFGLIVDCLVWAVAGCGGGAFLLFIPVHFILGFLSRRFPSTEKLIDRISDNLIFVIYFLLVLVVIGIYTANLLGYLPFDPIFTKK